MILLILIILSTITLAGSAALFSVTGLSKLFAGHQTEVIIMASSLEFGKLMLAFFIHRYWSKVNILFKGYLIIALIILMSITSMGIFGYLSDSYQINKGQFEVNNSKIIQYDNTINTLKNNIIRYNERVNTLNTLRKQQESRLDSATVRRWYNTAKRIEGNIKRADGEINIIYIKIDKQQDSINTLTNNRIALELKTNSGELGPLIYISKITNLSMDNTVKYLILLFILVFDPLAISFVFIIDIILTNKKGDKMKVESTPKKNVGWIYKLFKNQSSDLINKNDNMMNALTKPSLKEKSGVKFNLDFDELQKPVSPEGREGYENEIPKEMQGIPEVYKGYKPNIDNTNPEPPNGSGVSIEQILDDKKIIKKEPSISNKQKEIIQKVIEKPHAVTEALKHISSKTGNFK